MTLGEGRKRFQGFDYGLEPWETFHHHARNSVESVNAQIKRGGTDRAFARLVSPANDLVVPAGR